MKKIIFFLAISVILFAYSTFLVNAQLLGGDGWNFSVGGDGWGFSIGSGTSSGTWSSDMYSGLGLPGGTIFGILVTLVLWALGIFGIVAIIGFLIAGILYLTSAGNENQAEMAKRAMKYALIGIIVGLSGWVIIRAIDAALSTTRGVQF